VRASCHCYAAGEGWLYAAQRERDFVPELPAALEVIKDTLRVLVVALDWRDHGASHRPPATTPPMTSSTTRSR
jgi:hypothetical protein